MNYKNIEQRINKIKGVIGNPCFNIVYTHLGINIASDISVDTFEVVNSSFNIPINIYEY